MNIWHKIPLQNVLPSASAVEIALEYWARLKDEREFPLGKRSVLSKAIQNQYKGIEIQNEVAKNIRLLESDRAFTITTGQQIVTALGPWMVLYKIATAIHLAKKLSNQFPEDHFVPIFWMATEDHDWPEIAEIKKGDLHVKWENPSGGAVGRLSSKVMFEALRQWNLDHPEFLLDEEVLQAYELNGTLSNATRYLVNHIFGHHGLVVVDGDDSALKAMAAPLINAELSEQKLFHLAQKYNCQNGEIEIKPYNLFQLFPGQRTRVNTIEEAQEILSLSDLTQCSPNVALRIFYQETILPNLAYIGGPSEQRYWNQVAPFFKELNIPAPLFVLRERGVVMPEKWCRKWDALHWDRSFIMNAEVCLTDALKSKYGSEEVLIDLKETIEKAYSSHYAAVESEDPTLLNTAKGDCVKAIQMVEQLEKKIQRSRKRKEEEMVQFAGRWSQHILPKKHLAERWDYWIFDWQKNKHIVDVLIENVNAEDPFFKVWTI